MYKQKSQTPTPDSNMANFSRSMGLQQAVASDTSSTIKEAVS